MDFLLKQKEPLTSGEIAGAMEEGPSKTSRALKKLLINNEIKCMEINRLQAIKRCGCKHRVRLYYVGDCES